MNLINDIVAGSSRKANNESSLRCMVPNPSPLNALHWSCRHRFLLHVTILILSLPHFYLLFFLLDSTSEAIFDFPYRRKYFDLLELFFLINIELMIGYTIRIISIVISDLECTFNRFWWDFLKEILLLANLVSTEYKCEYEVDGFCWVPYYITSGSLWFKKIIFWMIDLSIVRIKSQVSFESD